MENRKSLWLTANDKKITVVEASTMDDASKLSPKASVFQPMEEYRLVKYDGSVKGYIYFQFYSGKLIIVNDHGTKILKIERSHEYTYKFLKTKVKAIDGQAGLMSFIFSCKDDISNPFNHHMFFVLNKIGA